VVGTRVDGDYLELTAESPIWDPHSTMLNDLEMRLVDHYGELKDNPGTHPRQLFALATETLLHKPFMKLRIFGYNDVQGTGIPNSKQGIGALGERR
jgi:hypothetical protein